MSYLTLNKSAAPNTPATGKNQLYVDTDGRHRTQDATGVNNILIPPKYNWLINSGFWFAQAANAALSGAATYTSVASVRANFADGWFGCNENASFTYQRLDTTTVPEAFMTNRYFGQVLKITNPGKLYIGQVLEHRDTCALRNQKVRLTVWIKNVGAAKNLRLGMISWASTVDTVPTAIASFISAYGIGGTDPTLGANLTYVVPTTGYLADNGTISGNAVTITLTAGWTRYSAVFTVPANSNNLIASLWSDQQIVATGGFSIGLCQLTLGESIVDWDPLPSVSEELFRCQRLYYKTFNADEYPRQNSGASTLGCLAFPCLLAGAVAGNFYYVAFPVEMRIAPATITFYNPAVANAFVRNATAGTDATATASAWAHAKGCLATCTGLAAWTVGQQLIVHSTFDARL